MAIYAAILDTDGAGAGNNLDGNGNPRWSGVFSGVLMAVRFDFSASADAGSDTTLTEPTGLARTLATKTNSNTDATFYPRFAETDNAGVAIGSYTPARVDSGNLKAAIAQGGATVTAAVTIYVDILEE